MHSGDSELIIKWIIFEIIFIYFHFNNKNPFETSNQIFSVKKRGVTLPTGETSWIIHIGSSHILGHLLNDVLFGPSF